jgi:hypothetical protein
MINQYQNLNMNTTTSSSRVLVVGKNSAIVKSIASNLTLFHLVSHKDLDAIDIHSYDTVFIFSWSHVSLNENLELLDKFELKRVVFISSIAVLACARRPQWASYPKWKLICENHILKAGGKVIRIGIWDATHINDLPGYVPITTEKALVNAMNMCLSTDAPVNWPIDLQPGKQLGAKRTLGRLVNGLSIVLPSAKIIQAPIALFLKVIGSKDYGYTHDCLQFFSERVLVGFGAVGSAVSHELTKRHFNHSIVTSLDNDLFLTSRGFRGLRIGQYKEGLSRLWHGVWISKTVSNTYQKNVPILVSRPRVPKRAIYGRVIKLDFDMPLPSVMVDNSDVKDVRIFADAIHLAAGVINNIKILQSTHQIRGSFSDHEIAEIGYIKSSELFKKGIITRRLGVVAGRKVFEGSCDGIKYILDFRPKCGCTIELDADNIYNNRADQIMRKLVKIKSLRLINQAIFNKFGIAADVGWFSAVIQVEVPNCIKLSEDGELSRNRLPKAVMDRVIDEIAAGFETFEMDSSTRTFDAIHVHGGFDLSEFPDLQHYLKQKRLFLHGNVFDGTPLGPFHNTIAMIKREREVIKSV